MNRWKEYERLLEGSEDIHPDQLSELYIQLTDDLAFARTHYPKRKTTRYLNNLASRVHLNIYQNKKERTNRFLSFFQYEMPYEMYASRRYMLYALITFVLSALIGAVSAHYDESYVRLILGDGYVNMTLDNIQKGEPMGVYQDMQPFYMFVRIALNNLWICARVFAFGMLLSIPVFFVLYSNGIMVGSFQYFFFTMGVGVYSVLSIWIHGTLEISTIVVAGGAGLTVGNSFIFPGTYSRAVSFSKGFKSGLKIMLGTLPIMLLAAILESWATRHTEWPVAVKASIIALSAVFVIWYYVWYPYNLYHHARQSR